MARDASAPPAAETEATPVAVASLDLSTVLVVVSAFTLLFAATWIVMLVLWPDPTSSQSSGMDALSHLATLGFGGLVGLVSGKLG